MHLRSLFSRVLRLAAVVALVGSSAMLAQAAPAQAVTPAVQTGTFTDAVDFDCGTFVLHNEITVNFRSSFFFDTASNLVRVQVVLNATGSWSGNGITTRDRQHGVETFDVATGSDRLVGLSFNVTVPGHGTIAQDTGVLIENADGTVVVHGPHEIFAATDQELPGLLCPAFT